VIGRQLTTLFLPVLTNMSDANWGNLVGKESQATKMEYLSRLNTFVATLDGAQESIDERIVLKSSEKIDWSQINTSSDYLLIASSPESLSHVEDCVKLWMRQIEIILAESEQIRREADNIGPRAELDYWKKRTSKFNYLLDQVKSHEVILILIIVNAKSI
jgi:dynein heavy chain